MEGLAQSPWKASLPPHSPNFLNMKPILSYRIWFSPRTGSTLLCKALASTSRAGTPQELFNLAPDDSLQQSFGIDSFEALQQALWETGSTPNGVFGIKHSLFAEHTDRLLQQLHQLMAEGDPKDEDAPPAFAPEREQAIWDALFPNCRHIFLTRRNKVRQAVSWWKAIKSQIWHRDPAPPASNGNSLLPAAFYEQLYDPAALNHLLRESALRECYTQEQFDHLGIQPLTLVYEDMIKDFLATVRKVLAFLELPAEGIALKTPNAYFLPTADDQSEAWVQRFRAEMHTSMKPRIW